MIEMHPPVPAITPSSLLRGTARVCDFCEVTIGARYSLRQLEVAWVSLPYLMCPKCCEACPWPPRQQVYAAIIRRAKRFGRKWGYAVAALLDARRQA